MNKFMFISLFLLLVSPPVGKANATEFLSPLSDSPIALDHLYSVLDASLPNEGALRKHRTIKGSVSDEPDLKLLAQSNSVSASATASQSAEALVNQEPVAQTDIADNSGTTTTSGDKCELTENGIVCNDSSESQILRSTSGSDQSDGKGSVDTEEAVNKIKGFLDMFK